MGELIPALLLGFLLGLRHALDPDHVVAVSNLAASEKSALKASKIGLLWGLGHAVVVFIVGAAWIFIGIHIPDSLNNCLETLVGFVLILLGLITIRRYRREQIHMHFHHHGGSSHAHFHSHTHGRKHNHQHSFFENGWVPFVIGCCHGMAGSAGVLLLTLSVVQESFVFWYLALFSLGTILSMGCLSLGLGILIRLANGKIPGIQRYVWLVSGLFSLVFGSWWIFMTIS